MDNLRIEDRNNHHKNFFESTTGQNWIDFFLLPTIEFSRDIYQVAIHLSIVLFEIKLRPVQDSDLDIFYKHQQDPEALDMAAFTSKDPSDRTAFDNHWNKIMNDQSVDIRTICVETEVVGHIAKFVSYGDAEVTYWIGREYWGKGITTEALNLFLEEIKQRPLYARAAKDNIGSIRVLEKCGFILLNFDRGFANARGVEIEEVVMQLK